MAERMASVAIALFLLAAAGGAVVLKGQHGVEGVEVLLIQLILHHFDALGKALVVDDLPLAQVAQHVDHVRVVRLEEQVLVGGAGLLLWYDLISTT